jgi:endoribonuclease Dicer
MPLDAPGAKVKVMSALVVHEKVVCHGIAASGRYAKLAASKNALALLQGLAPFEFRDRYGCACVKVEEGGVEGVEVDGEGGKISLEKVMGTAI